MCLLIVVRGLVAEHPVVVASNRDELRARKASPPGLWSGQRHRVLSPRDRLAGGTWLGVNDAGMFAGITNVSSAPPPAGAPSRGHLVHQALDQDDLAAAAAVVTAAVRARTHGGFQLVLCDGRSTVVLRHAGGMVTESDWREPVLVVSNEHAPGRLRLPGLPDAAALPRDARELLQCLRPLLLDEGGAGRHPVLKRGDLYGTVSSSLLAVPPAGMPQRLLWLYASGAPDVTPYRDYGNLGKRLLPVDDGALG